MIDVSVTTIGREPLCVEGVLLKQGGPLMMRSASGLTQVAFLVSR